MLLVVVCTPSPSFCRSCPPAFTCLPPLLPLALERLHSLVENRTVYALEGFELNVFETHRAAHRVPLRLEGLALTTMLRGKKVMHLPGRAAFDYLPGEIGGGGQRRADGNRLSRCLPVPAHAVPGRGHRARYHSPHRGPAERALPQSRTPPALGHRRPRVRPPHQHPRADRHAGPPGGRVAHFRREQGRAGRLHPAGIAGAPDADAGPPAHFPRLRPAPHHAPLRGRGGLHQRPSGRKPDHRQAQRAGLHEQGHVLPRIQARVRDYAGRVHHSGAAGRGQAAAAPPAGQRGRSMPAGGVQQPVLLPGAV